MSSHHKQRIVAKQWSGSDYEVEDAPFYFPVKDHKGKYEIASAPWGYLMDLVKHVHNRLDALDRYTILSLICCNSIYFFGYTSRNI